MGNPYDPLVDEATCQGRHGYAVFNPQIDRDEKSGEDLGPVYKTSQPVGANLPEILIAAPAGKGGNLPKHKLEKWPKPQWKCPNGKSIGCNPHPNDSEDNMDAKCLPSGEFCRCRKPEPQTSSLVCVDGTL